MKAEVLCGDCLEVMATLSDVSVNAIIADPPYCSGGSLEAQKNTGLQGVRTANRSKESFRWFRSDNMTTGGLVWLLRSMIVESNRLLRPDSSALIFTDWRMVPHLAPALESAGLRYRNMIVWDKGNTGLGMGFRPCHEIILEFVNGVNPYYSKAGSNLIRSSRVPPLERKHQTQKPVDLLANLINVICPPGGLVLDPFAGSGSTGMACVRTGRQFIGIEADPEYAAVARRRIAEATAEPPLFAAPTPDLFTEVS